MIRLPILTAAIRAAVAALRAGSPEPCRCGHSLVSPPSLYLPGSAVFLAGVPEQAERLACRVGVHTPVLALAVECGRTERQHALLGCLDLVHRHVEVELLRVRRIRPPRGLVVLDLLEHDRLGAVLA